MINYKLLITTCLIWIGITFSGCTPKVEIRYVDRPVEYPVPVKCVIPKPDCNKYKDSNETVVFGLIQCIKDWNDAAKVCEKIGE